MCISNHIFNEIKRRFFFFFFECVGKKTHFDFFQKQLYLQSIHKNDQIMATARPQLSFTESCFQALLGHLGELTKKVNSFIPFFSLNTLFSNKVAYTQRQQLSKC